MQPVGLNDARGGITRDLREARTYQITEAQRRPAGNLIDAVGGAACGFAGACFVGDDRSTAFSSGKKVGEGAGLLTTATGVGGVLRGAVKFGLSRLAKTQSDEIAGSAAKAADDVMARLPAYSGGKTQRIFEAGGKQVDLISGYKGPSASLPRGTPGMHGNIKSHVEAHAAALMRQGGIDEATLYINRIPCPGVRGCHAMLPRMLPEGARLHVRGPNGFRKTYTGLPD